MRSPFRVALAVVSCAILLFIGATSADVPAISLKAPTVAPDAGHSVVGVVLSPDMRARLRRQGGSLTVQWASSLGRGCLTRAADDGRMDATFDLKGLDPGTVTMIASLTTGGQTIDSTPVTTGLFSVDVQPANATVVQGQTFVETISTSPDTAALVQVTWQVASSVDGAVLSSGVVPVSAFGPDGQGRLVATQTFLAPSAFTGIAILTISAAASSLDAFGTPTTATASSAVTLTIQPSTSMPLALAFTTASGQGFPAGATADLEFTLQTQDPSTTQASFTVFDTQKSVVAHGPATLTQTGATSASGVASWAVPAGAGGQYTVTVLATQGSQSVTASLAINVVPAAGPALAIAPSGPITVTAGQAATVGFTLTGVASLAGATLTAVFTDRTTGAVLSSATIDPATLVQQPGGFAGGFTFSFPVTSVTLDTTLTITYLENGAPVASGAIGVLVQPALAQIVVSIGNAPSQAAAGTSPPLTIVISGVTVQLMSSVSWSLKDGLGSTVATANVSLSQLVLVGTHYETTVPMTLSPSIAPGTYTLEAAMTTTAGATFTAVRPIAITEAVLLRIVQAASTIDEGTVQSFQALLRPRVEVGLAKWLFTNGVGVAAPGFPSGTVATSDLIAVTDSDGTAAWLIGVTFTVPSGTVTVQTLVHFVLSVFDPAGRPLASAETQVMVQPAFPVRLTSVQPSSIFPGMRVTLTGAGFSPVLGQNVVVTTIGDRETTLAPESVTPDGTSLSVRIPLSHPVGAGSVRVETRGTASNPSAIRVMGMTEIKVFLDNELAVRMSQAGLDPRVAGRLARAQRFYNDEVSGRMVLGRLGGRFGRIATLLRQVGRELARAREAGASTADLEELIGAWATLLESVPEVHSVDFNPSTRPILRPGQTRHYNILLLDAARRVIPLSAFPPALRPAIAYVSDTEHRADVTFDRTLPLSIDVTCHSPFRSVITGAVAFASSGTALSRYATIQGTWVPFRFIQEQSPPTVPPIQIVAENCFTIIESVSDPDPEHPRWLPRGRVEFPGTQGAVHEFKVWWVRGSTLSTRGLNVTCLEQPGKFSDEVADITVRMRTTAWRGICGNWGSGDEADFQFEPVVIAPRWQLIQAAGLPVNAGDVRTAQSAVKTFTVLEGQCVHLLVSTMDFGGSAELVAQARHGDQECAPGEILVPYDQDDDLLPDKFEIDNSRFGFEKNNAQSVGDEDQHKGNDGEADSDRFPASSGVPVLGVRGDGLTAFEEYRGFVMIGTQHRTSPGHKDLFLKTDVPGLNTLDVGVGFIEELPGLGVWRIGPAELISSNNFSGRITREFDRAINVNSVLGGVPGATTQRALVVRNGNCDGPGGLPDGFGTEDQQGRRTLTGVVGCVHVGVVNSGPNGINNTAGTATRPLPDGDDRALFDLGNGSPNTVAIAIVDFRNVRTYLNDIANGGPPNPPLNDSVFAGLVLTGDDGIRQVPKVYGGDREIIGFRQGDPFTICVEAGLNGTPETDRIRDDENVFKNVTGHPLGTPNEIFEIDVNSQKIIDILQTFFNQQAPVATVNDWIRTVMAHECGHGIHIEHHKRSNEIGEDSIMQAVFDVSKPPARSWRNVTEENRLHLKHK